MPAPDAQLVLAQVRRQLAGASTQLADGFARLVGDASDGRLHWVMRSPLRRPVFDAIFWQMPKHLDCERAAGLDGSVRWLITAGHDDVLYTYDLVFDDGRCHVRRGGGSDAPKVTIKTEGTEFLRLVTGESDPLQAYFSRRLAVSGDIMFAAKLSSLFRIPRTRSGRHGGRSGGPDGRSGGPGGRSDRPGDRPGRAV